MQNRKENVQLIVTLNQRGQLVYKDSAPALLEASLRRLKNILQGQVLHCEDAAYAACKAVHPAPHLLDMNGSHTDDISKAYRKDNWDYLKGENKYEIEHWMVDYLGSGISVHGHESMMLARKFISRLHVAQYCDTIPEQDAVVSRGTLTETDLRLAGYVLESSEYETLNIRAGGPTCAKYRHTVWRHESVRRQTVPVLPVDDTAWAMAVAERSRRIEEHRKAANDGIDIDAVHRRLSVSSDNYFQQLQGLR